jgi:hypothetical protein
LLVGFAVLAGLLAGAYFLYRYVTGVFATLDPQIEVVLAVASIVALLCAVIISEGLKARGRNDPYSIVAGEPAKTYERLLLLCCERLREQGHDARQVTEAEMSKAEQLLALHGSAKAASAYLEVRRVLNEGKTGEGSAALSKLLAQMRKDLGRDLMANADDILSSERTAGTRG